MNVLQICVFHTFLTILILHQKSLLSQACSSGCTCTTVPEKNEESAENDGETGDTNGPEADELGMPQDTKGRKVDCSNNPYRFSSIEDLNRAITIPLDTIYLDLSKNEISVLRKESFSQLSDLQRLDLSHNRITLIEPGAFEGLSELRRLDLSNNNLGSINGSIFSGLPNLQKLMLSFNKLNTIPDGTFSDLPALRRLDFQSDYLRCDCHLKWIVKWTKYKKVKIKSSTTCAVPKELKGTALKRLKQKDLHCDRPLELPLFEIKPGMSQIVFEGDKLPFDCQASVVDPNTKMFWLRRGAVVETNRSQGIFIHTRKTPDNTVMMHSLVLEDLKSPQSGKWLCLVSTPQGNVTKTVTIVVIDSNAPQCEKNTTKTNKGVYMWEATVAGVTKELPCKLGDGKISHLCDKQGRWTNLNHTACDFTNELTRKLQSLAENTNSSKILNDAKNLEKLVSAPFRNNEDPLSTINPEYVDLASMAIYRLSQRASLGEEIVRSVLFSASKIMNISTSILNEAQRQRKSLSRISKAVESIPGQFRNQAKFSQSAEFIVMEARSFAPSQFTGIQCSRLDLTFDQTAHRLIQSPSGFVFVCSEAVNDTSNYAYLNLEPLTSILIPKSVLDQAKPEVKDIGNATTTTTPGPGSNIHFQFIWYHNANLFPIARGRNEDQVLQGKSWNVISSVISVSMSVPVENLTEPVEIVFEIPATTKSLVPVYWDYSANGGYGDWRTDGCLIVDKKKTLVTVHCDHLTAFAILEDESEVRANMFQMMEIVVYIGSCICLLCLMAVIITYVSCFKFLNIPRKMKHSVINICVSVLLLIIGFTMGIKRTDHERACQIVGIVLHYLSMVAMFWFTVTASNMLKKFTKAEKPPPPPADFPMPLPPKPIIRFYLLAWGVPTIICGITAAVSFDFYDEYDYCFLEWEPGLGAFVGPVAFLLLLNCIFFIRISCVIRSSTGPLLNVEETQELHITDIEMTSNQDRIETQSLTSEMSVKSTVSSVMDFERRPITQLRALAVCLLLYIFTWIFGAITVAKPFSAIPYQEIIFSYLYGVFCAILGLFILIYFCLTRKDSRSSWKRFFLCEQQAVYDANQMTSNSVPQANGHVNTGSGTDISKVNSTVVVNHSNHINHVKKSDDEASSINLVPSKPPSVVDGSLSNSLNEATAASFYNPRQNGVAKKFWEKKNKHNSKLLSKEMTKSLNMNGTDSDFSASERPRGISHGYSSDGHGPNGLNLDLQFQGRNMDTDTQSARSPIRQQSPPSYTAVMANGPFHQYGQPTREQTASPQNQRPEILTGSPNCSIVSYTSSRIVPHHTRTPSSSSLGNRNQTSAFVPVQPRNNTLPRNGMPVSQSVPSSPEKEVPDQTISGPSSVARLGDFDGSSQVSSSYSHERLRSPRPGDLPYMSGYSSPPDMSMYKQYGLIDGQPQTNIITPTSQPYRNRTNSGGYSSDNSSKHRKRMENNFIQQVEQRIPQGANVNHTYPNHVNSNHVNSTHGNHVESNNAGLVTHKPPLSPMSDSENNTGRRTFPDSDSQIHYKKHRYNDSDHNSEPTKSHKSHDSHKHSRHRGMTKQRSLDWDKQFKDNSPSNAIPYAYVNHNYTDRVLQKLTNMAISEHIDPTSKAFWVPRSSRSYNELVKKEKARLCEDSSTSSDDDDDDSLDNIWVLQKEKRAKKNKKETSV
ncbi:adhesion G protein-coupled receptor A3-like isoform X2 [Mercenaria mercenaria]|uniref:adhesion G protein-coupled receptor A3-like isoform X2 n=1 Tax=Mercenaria mercenaria TaxID=6596 RepID=UPI00234E5BC3|nr:adhesion G protein-coupled receptor A3-like isoform X2 [Mercenaria mercenaria]